MTTEIYSSLFLIYHPAPGSGGLMAIEPLIDSLYADRGSKEKITIITGKGAGTFLNRRPLHPMIHSIHETNLSHDEAQRVADMYDYHITPQVLSLYGLPAPEGFHGISCTVDNFPLFQGLSVVQQASLKVGSRLRRELPSIGDYSHAFANTKELLKEPSELLTDKNCGITATGFRVIDPSNISEADLLAVATCRVFIGRVEDELYHYAVACGVPFVVGIYGDEADLTDVSDNWKMGYTETLLARASDPDEIARKIKIAIQGNPTPRYLNEGNARQGILGKALQHCKGHGIDVGSNQWPFPGALACDVQNRDEQFAKGPFDFVFSSHCLEHITNWQDEIKLWDKSLHKGGSLFLFVPHPCFKPWHPEGDWVKGGWHVWPPEPVNLAQWISQNTSIEVQEYSVYPMYGSFWLLGVKR